MAVYGSAKTAKTASRVMEQLSAAVDTASHAAHAASHAAHAASDAAQLSTTPGKRKANPTFNVFEGELQNSTPPASADTVMFEMSAAIEKMRSNVGHGTASSMQAYAVVKTYSMEETQQRVLFLLYFADPGRQTTSVRRSLRLLLKDEWKDQLCLHHVDICQMGTRYAEITDIKLQSNELNAGYFQSGMPKMRKLLRGFYYVVCVFSRLYVYYQIIHPVSYILRPQYSPSDVALDA